MKKAVYSRMATVVSAVAIMTVAATAQADWQYTKWGMSVSEVVAASQDKATAREPASKAPDVELRTLLETTYKTGEFDFKVTFGFNVKSGGLTLVELSLLSPTVGKCKALEDSLRDTYGATSESSRGAVQVHTWRDEKSSNRVRYYNGYGLCGLHYAPLIERTNSGL